MIRMLTRYLYRRLTITLKPQTQNYRHFYLMLLGLGLALGLSVGHGVVPGWAGEQSRAIALSPPQPLSSSTALAAESLAPDAPKTLLEQGRQAFAANQLEAAIDLWQQALAQSQTDLAFHAIVWNQVAIAHQRLNQWPEAQTATQNGLQAIDAALEAANTGASTASQQALIHVQAQLLNTRGRGEWAVGQLDAALATWEQATDRYDTVGDEEGRIGSQINQVQALETLGYYRSACNKVLDVLAVTQSCDDLGLPSAQNDGSLNLDAVLHHIDQQANAHLKILSLRSLGNLLRLTGQLPLSQQVLSHGLDTLPTLSAHQKTLTQLSLATTQRDRFTQTKLLYDRTKLPSDRQLAAERAAQALATYDGVIEQMGGALATPGNPPDPSRLHAQLQRLQLLIDLESWNQAAARTRTIGRFSPPGSATTWPALEPQVALILEALRTPLPLSRDAVDIYLNLAQQLLGLQPLLPQQDWLAVAQTMAQTGVTQADQLGDRRSQSYAYGVLGQVYEQQGLAQTPLRPSIADNSWDQSRQITRHALSLAQAAQIPEIAYRWQWQMGRLAEQQQQPEDAIAYYEAAVQTLDTVRDNLLGIDADVQFSFRNNVEPIYRRLVELLLTQGDEPPSQEILQRAIRDIDALQLSELENFLGCNLTESVAISETRVDPNAAVVYPIILQRQLAVITKLPQTERLNLHTVDIEQSTLDNKLITLRRELARPYRSQTGLRLSQELYNWLIRPIEPLLAETDTQTLVFVLDGKLRNVPMATLHNGTDYLVKQYALALMPGLQLIKPQALADQSLDVLTFGLSQMRQQFPPHNGFEDLENVEAEVSEIQNQLPSRLFLNQAFTQTALAERIQAIDAPIVHLATHGQFSSEPSDTFVLAWDQRIDINALSAILRARNTEANPIELLVLSACKTAEGDDRAALGLAGIAVRSGARSTLASLWTVDDQATADMMSQFYRELAQADTPIARSEALRRAQVKLLDSDFYNAPRYWSPFILVGNWL